jgi:leucyl-tRNA synthetase
MKSYDHKKIEKKWQKVWEKTEPNKAKGSSSKKKFYPLIEFPYPSGEGLHVGHIRSNTAMDIIARKRRMEGFNVLYPIGWDAFGLPTENYAIKTGIHPKIVTKRNTDNFRKQLKQLGFSFDWSREINTTDPAYYKWTQWIFLQFFKKGLAYKATRPINWCINCKVGLADEEVVDGRCERCGGPTEKREKEQWMMAITKYAERLDKDLDDVDYLEKIKTQQRNWIGKSEGAEIDFILDFKNSPDGNINRGADGKPTNITVFTTRADTLFGVTYLVLSPEHPWLTVALDASHNILLNKKEVNEYVEGIKIKTEIERTDAGKEKTGVEIKGVKAINPANGEELPIYVADYVLAHYGTGAIMAVPAHDDRDMAFAKKFKLPIVEVIEPLFEIHHGSDALRKDLPYVKRNAVVCIVKHWSEEKYLCLKWKKADWTGFVVGGIEKDEDPVETGVREIFEETGFKNAKFVKKLGGTIHSRFYHVIKKQNRWGYFTGLYFELQNGEKQDIAEEEKEIHDLLWLTKKEVSQVVNDDMLLFWNRSEEKVSNLVITDGILANSGKFSGMESEEARKKIIEFVKGKIKTTFKLRDWVFSRQRYWGEPIPVIHCPTCGFVAVPDNQLPVELPTVKKYAPTDDGESPLALISKWVNVKCPTCKGPAKRETDTMPNWAGSSWYYLRYTDPKNKNAFASAKALKYFTPVDWYNGGMEHTTLHLLYSRFWHKFLFDQKLVPTNEPYVKRTSHGMILSGDGTKISKSKGNGVKPEEVIVPYGADSVRLYEMFMGPFDQAVSWDSNGIVGVRRFIERVWKLQDKIVKESAKSKSIDKNIQSTLHKTLKKVTEDIEELKFNTAISSMMILVNELDRHETIAREVYESLVTMLAPFTPHVTEEIWELLGNKKSIHLEKWPIFKDDYIVSDEITIAVQVDGKIRATFKTMPGVPQPGLEKIALALEGVIKWLPEGVYSKVFYVKDRLINFLSR